MCWTVLRLSTSTHQRAAFILQLFLTSGWICICQPGFTVRSWAQLPSEQIKAAADQKRCRNQKNITQSLRNLVVGSCGSIEEPRGIGTLLKAPVNSVVSQILNHQLECTKDLGLALQLILVLNMQLGVAVGPSATWVGANLDSVVLLWIQTFLIWLKTPLLILCWIKC